MNVVLSPEQEFVYLSEISLTKQALLFFSIKSCADFESTGRQISPLAIFFTMKPYIGFKIITSKFQFKYNKRMNESSLKNTPEHKVNITNEKWKSNHIKL